MRHDLIYVRTHIASHHNSVGRGDRCRVPVHLVQPVKDDDVPLVLGEGFPTIAVNVRGRQGQLPALEGVEPGGPHPMGVGHASRMAGALQVGQGCHHLSPEECLVDPFGAGGHKVSLVEAAHRVAVAALE